MTEIITSINEDQQEIIQQIFSSIDSIGQLMESTVDLHSDVFPFMRASLAKIKQLTLATSAKDENIYELFQISTNYLPRALNAYCSLPLEYRNTKKIKSDKTARTLLIEDLKIFKQQVQEIEKQIYAGIENQIKVNSNVVRSKYEQRFQLASEVENLEEDGFINQFDFNDYSQNQDYTKITFKKMPSAKQIADEKTAQTLKFVKDTGFSLMNGLSKLFKGIISGLEKFVLAVLDFFEPIFVPAIIIAFVGGAIYLLTLIPCYSNYTQAYLKTAASIHEVMAVSLIPQVEFEQFAKTKQQEMIDGSSYRKERTKFAVNAANQSFSMSITGIDKRECKSFIDNKEIQFDAANIKINGIALPQDNEVSNWWALENENHKLCHLEGNNQIIAEFDNKKINNYKQLLDSLTTEQKSAKLSRLEKELTIVEKEKTKYSKDTGVYRELNDMSEKIKEAMKKYIPQNN